MERILITGNLGYIGIILTEELLKNDYNIIGVDTCFYNDIRLYEFNFNREFKQLKKDIRKINLEDLKGINAIIHLAALSNDPVGQLNTDITNDINFKASLRLAKLAKKVKVSKFLFASTCSVYGDLINERLNESSLVNPLTAYSKSKVGLERELSKLADKIFSPVYLRTGTVYGISPNMRFDSVVNNLAGWAYTTKEIKILSDGQAWRPIVHIRDTVNAFIAALKASKEIIHNEVFNVGINSENYQVENIAEEIHKQKNDCEIKITGKNSPDKRSYKVNFDKIKNNFKHFKPKWNLKKGIEELYNIFENINLDFKMFQNKNFTRINQLKYLLENKLIDESLYWI